MEFEWDENKNLKNIKKHGISFKRATKIFISGNVLEWIDDRYDYGEERIIALGRSERIILYVVYTWRGNARRIISARRATKNERRKYLAVYP
ncbi:TPA: BrnT family toxin [Candidatus Poribacteria bacterium]|nr:BrnT family toxin [Candidatus Poribacteria bacterium]